MGEEGGEDLLHYEELVADRHTFEIWIEVLSNIKYRLPTIKCAYIGASIQIFAQKMQRDGEGRKRE